MRQQEVMNELESLGYTGATLVDSDSHAAYYDATSENGTRYEFKTCQCDYDEHTELWQRQEGKEDWYFLFDLTEASHADES